MPAFVPLHSILVVRDKLLVDAFAEYKKTGKAFDFTDDEVKDITAAQDGQVELSLRKPSDEKPVEVEQTQAPTASNEQAGEKDEDL